jgi:hypothetical protein
MKRKSILSALLMIAVIAGCQPKTAEDIYQDNMKGKTDQQLIQEIDGRPQSYKVIKAVTTQFYEDNPYAQKIKQGGVLQVIFNGGEIYLKEFGTLNGSYEGKYYASTDGSVWIKFTIPNDIAAGISPHHGNRVNPLDESRYLALTYNYQLTKGNTVYHLNTVYTLERLELNN